ncbi:hypothetical protein [Streptomyces atroolivaceus]|uniref:Uncharacterized protein n=1 Tax=Streptomyces atroolivaceus TaxID=66869 RepID=A0ABV9VCL2_STRAZ|nr:hypothetical protein [Streptomyces atroolivaceus]
MSLVSGVLGAAFGSVISAAVNYLVIGMPESASVNALNHGISGLISGFAAGCIGLMVHLRKGAAQRLPVPPQEDPAATRQG